MAKSSSEVKDRFPDREVNGEQFHRFVKCPVFDCYEFFVSIYTLEMHVKYSHTKEDFKKREELLAKIARKEFIPLPDFPDEAEFVFNYDEELTKDFVKLQKDIIETEDEKLLSDYPPEPESDEFFVSNGITSSIQWSVMSEPGIYPLPNYEFYNNSTEDNDVLDLLKSDFDKESQSLLANFNNLSLKKKGSASAGTSGDGPSRSSRRSSAHSSPTHPTELFMKNNSLKREKVQDQRNDFDFDFDPSKVKIETEAEEMSFFDFTNLPVIKKEPSKGGKSLKRLLQVTKREPEPDELQECFLPHLPPRPSMAGKPPKVIARRHQHQQQKIKPSKTGKSFKRLLQVTNRSISSTPQQLSLPPRPKTAGKTTLMELHTPANANVKKRKLKIQQTHPNADELSEIDMEVDGDIDLEAEASRNILKLGSDGLPIYDPKFILKFGLRRISNMTGKPYVCPVPNCHKGYKNPNGIKYHAYYGHSDKKCFPCICGKIYTTRSGLLAHFKIAHPNVSRDELTCL